VPIETKERRLFREPLRHAIIIGGGASGAILSYQLLRHCTSGLRVTLIEKRPEVGRGIAYHTANPDHLLNVRASNMSALPEDPGHFWRWLAAQPADSSDPPVRARCADPYCFAPRQLYGQYIASLIGPLQLDDERRSRLSIIQAECVGVHESPSDVTAEMIDGTCIAGDVAILATGHEVSLTSGCYADPWTAPSAAGLARDVPVLILGTGLTMIDCVLSLLLEGHKGPIIAISRRGLLPRVHRRIEPVRVTAAEVPFGADVKHLFRWFRDRVARHVAEGGDWRSVVDGIRPHTQRIWRHLSMSSRRRFLEHARAWWDVHRHRMAPEVETRIANAIASGHLTVIAAKLVDVEQIATGACVLYRRRGESNVAKLNVAKIIDCTGIVKDPMRTNNPVIRSLLDQNLARVDPLRIGLEVSSDCAIVDGQGTPSPRLFAIGPLTRAAFWEIIAVPDIRDQCAELAARLAAGPKAWPNGDAASSAR
jgi:uncharacterized NAD(P)/FAD-binding protein YdhS